MTAMSAKSTAPPEAVKFLHLERLRKTYPGVVALNDFSMEVQAGEVIGLVGENGAGKSTLMKILGGVIAPDEGVITINGIEKSSLSVEESIEAGIEIGRAHV